ncbi:MAG: malate dehydrogenase [Crenarchaeota archaeon]|nr:malate dehydrogenase [Thermoproteota archaeon]
MPLVTIVGAGRVGVEVAEHILLRDLADVLLIDVVPGRAEGEALDLAHEVAMLGIDRDVRGSMSYDDCYGSDVVVIVAGAPRKHGMTREDLLHVNASIVRDVASKVAEKCPKAKIVVVTNPVNAMTYVAWRVSGFDRSRVVGFGPLLDSARLRYVLAKMLGKPPRAIQPLVIGQHGEAMVPVLSSTFVEGKRASDLLSEEERKRVWEEVKRAGAKIIELRGYSANHAPGLGVAMIVEAMLRSNPILVPAIAILDGEYGVRGLPLGVPCIVGGRGLERVIEVELSEEERREFARAAERIRQLLLELPPEIRPSESDVEIRL